MDFYECLSRYLQDNELLQTRFNSRVYPMMLPQKPVYPAIVYTPVNASHDNALLGHTGFIREKIQFSVYDKSFGGARVSSRLLKKVLQDYTGDMYDVRIQATHTLFDSPSGLGTITNYDTEEYSWVLEFEFNYMDN